MSTSRFTEPGLVLLRSSVSASATPPPKEWPTIVKLLQAHAIHEGFQGRGLIENAVRLIEGLV